MLDVTLSLLLQTREIDGVFCTNMRYNQAYRTERNLQLVEDLWEQHYGGLPLRIYVSDQGVDEVVSLVSSQTTPSLILIDHAYAIVGQSAKGTGLKEHQQYINLFSRVRAAIKRRNHVGIMFNQFKLSGRADSHRGPDAQYGGSGVQNIMATMLHIWPEDSEEAVTSNGFRLINSLCVKIRAMILADENGFPIDPRGQEDRFWLENRYRKIVDRLPIG
jgi:hypothetical protein